MKQKLANIVFVAIAVLIPLNSAKVATFSAKLRSKHGLIPATVRQDDCSSFLTDLTGEFSSPNYPGDYPNNAICTWEIEVPEGYRIRLTFPEFRLETSSECHKDFVEIYDGNDFLLFCGREKPPPVDSVANVMSVMFISDDAIHAGDKFLAEYVAFQGELTTSDPTGSPQVNTDSSTTTTTIRSTTEGGGGGDYNCSMTLDVGDPLVFSFFSTPNYPAAFPAGTKCRWEIIDNSEKISHSQVGKIDYVPDIRVGFLSFKTQTGDLAEVFFNGTETPYASLDGNQNIDNGNHTLATAAFRNGKNITVTFDAAKSDEGFLFFAAKDVPRIFTTDDRRKENPAKLRLKNLPRKGKKFVNVDLVTGKISASDKKLLKLVNLAKKHGFKRQDELNYGHFTSPNHPNFYNNQESVVYKFTAAQGQKIAFHFPRFNTEPHQDWLILQESSGIARLRDAKQDCSEYLTGMNGEFSSPNYPGDYPNNAICVWEVEVPIGYQVHLTFEEFHLENSPNCDKDYVEIYDGFDYFLYCGREFPPAVVSRSNGLSVTLVTDGEIHLGNRFKAFFQAVDGSISTTTTPNPGMEIPIREMNRVEIALKTLDVSDMSIFGYFRMSPGHPQNYTEGLNYTWVITNNFAPDNSSETTETRIVFLRFKTSPYDPVTVRTDIGAFYYAGNLQNEISNDCTIYSLPYLDSHLLATHVNFVSRPNGFGYTDSGFLFFVTRSIPPDPASRLEETTQQIRKPLTEVESQNKLEGLKTPKVVVTIDMRKQRITANFPGAENYAGFGTLDDRQDFNSSFGWFSSPNHPSRYPFFQNIQYNILAHPGERIALAFPRFALETNYDYLVITDPLCRNCTLWPNINNDIALIALNRKIDYVSGAIEPAWLPYPDQEFFLTATAIGWGAIDENEPGPEATLRKVELNLVSNRECAAAYANVEGFAPVLDTMICAGVPEGGKGSCGGDSGGPLICTDWEAENRKIPCGITSWSLGCAKEGYPTVFTNISSYRNWIGSWIGL
ncbi:unnamed protein product [Notodromas monacha]|uniref:Uncharacterized protein n=1 Tax=Notodromas monacha TaxID=399045 RepID=A0A7R9BUA6_9CRUS|nr:unnamed protein product [Notodromas monacha]CAG0921876.1 unnamed protein product [Notodromas monacha]